MYTREEWTGMSRTGQRRERDGWQGWQLWGMWGRRRGKENKAERRAGVETRKHGRLTGLSSRQPLTAHVALLGASTGRGGRPGWEGVWVSSLQADWRCHRFTVAQITFPLLSPAYGGRFYINKASCWAMTHSSMLFVPAWANILYALDHFSLLH